MSVLSTAHVYPAGHGQWAFVAGARSGTGYPSKAAARDAAASALKAQSKAPAVDVLAVLDALCERAASGDPAEYREVNSLRYAVTELIEAVGLLTDSANPEIAGWSETVTALARVKGA